MKNITTIFARLLSRLHYGTRLHPTRDWLVVLALSVLLLAASIALNVLVFLGVTGGEILGGGSVTPIAPPALDEVHALFDTRAAEAGRYESEYRFIDPSL